jgi:hypothetical protein
MGFLQKFIDHFHSIEIRRHGQIPALKIAPRLPENAMLGVQTSHSAGSVSPQGDQAAAHAKHA